MDSNRDIAHFIEGYFSSLRHGGYIIGHRVEHRFEMDAFEITLDFEGNRHERHIFTAHEFAMGGLDGLRDWCRHVDDSIRHRAEAERYRSMMAAAPPTLNQMGGLSQYGAGVTQQEEYHRFQQQLNAIANQQADALSLGLSSRLGAGIGAGLGGYGETEEQKQKREKAEKKAKDLFIKGAGKDAFDKLESGKSVAITGSKGTEYTLHKRASYCIERVSDGTKFCAVVPSVPLYDHLLGIKLMVEHDEPKFLKTANKANGLTTTGADYVGYANLFNRGLAA